jgi:hypothetical protein
VGALRGVALVAGVTIVGTAIILVAHALSPVPTHVTTFERTGGGSSGILGTIADRLGTGFDLLRGSPAAWIPVVGLVVTLVGIARPTPAIRATRRSRAPSAASWRISRTTRARPRAGSPSRSRWAA